MVEKVSGNPGVQSQLHAMESAGYKAVHSQFSDEFHDVDWQSASAGKVRSTDIKNSKGEPVCTLKETTFDTAKNVALSDGTGRVVRGYRQVEFQTQLTSGKGPVHFSMAVKDENGKNIAEKDAVYFTAHYNESGELEEVSSPAPVKFMGKGDDAIGYIERNGKAYTLPVTQGKYNEMMKAVTKNNGINADLSHSVEKPASDLVITNKTVPKELAAQVSTLRERVVKSTVTSVGHATTPPIPGKGDKGRGV